MMNAVMAWIDGSWVRYWLIGAPLFTAVLVLACLDGGRCTASGRIPFGRGTTWLRHPATFLLALTIGLLYFRLPVTTSWAYLNEDEGNFVAGAITLTHDPVFWRSVQSTTSGPLNYYPLAVCGALGSPIDYSSARLFGSVLHLISLWALYAAARLMFEDRVARLAVLPCWAYLALTMYWEIAPYASEQVPMTLLSLASYLLLRTWLVPRCRYLLLGMLGALLGMLPFAKLQTVPIGFAIAAVAYATIVVRSLRTGVRCLLREASVLSLAGVAPAILVFSGAWWFGVYDEFLHTYLLWNVEYAGQADVSLPVEFVKMARVLRGTPDINTFMRWGLLTGVIEVGLFSLAMLRSKASVRIPDVVQLCGVNGVLFLSAAVYAILVTGEVDGIARRHYLLLLVFPLGLLLVCATGLVWSAHFRLFSSKNLVAMLIIAATFHMGCERFLKRAMFLEPAPYYDKGYQPSDVAAEITRYSDPDDAIVVWGWAPRYYVMAQRRQGTPMPGCERVATGARQSYYREQFLRAFRVSRPAVFVDEVGPSSHTYQDRKLYGHEVFPELTRLLCREYRIVRDFDVRIYVRKDRLAKPS